MDHYGSKSEPQLYHNLTGYPQLGLKADTNEINTEYYDYYYDYEPQPQPQVKKNDVIISPHPFVVAVQRFMSGLQARQFDLGGLFTGNTVVSKHRAKIQINANIFDTMI